MAVALFGLVFGSFLNVCIYRLPRGESIVRPRSHCPGCGKAIGWYDNIPVLSYLVLRGRCRNCRERVSPIYPLVEILTAVLLVLAFARSETGFEFAKNALLTLLLVVIMFTDLLERRIPFVLTVPGIAAGLVLSLAIPVENQPVAWLLSLAGIDLGFRISSVVGAVSGALFGAGMLYLSLYALELVNLIRPLNLPEDVLGFGDVMLMLMVGTFLGVPLTFLTMLLAVVFALVAAICLYAASPRFRHHYAWPLGTFLAASGIYAALGGSALVDAYLRATGAIP